MIVDGARPSRRAIDRIDSPRRVPIMISSRSAIDNRGRTTPLGSHNCGFTPPNVRNHSSPQVADTPTTAAASSVDKPRATNSQNDRSTEFNVLNVAINTNLSFAGVATTP